MPSKELNLIQWGLLPWMGLQDCIFTVCNSILLEYFIKVLFISKMSEFFTLFQI